MRIEMLIGLPGSGKSTYAKSKASKGYIIVDIDHIVLMTNGGAYNFIERRRSLYGSMVRSLLDDALSHGHNVVIDTTNLTKDLRKYYINTYGDEHEVVGIYWHPRPNINLYNRLLEPRGYDRKRWKQIIDRMVDVFEAPSADEGFSDLAIKEVKKYRRPRNGTK